MAQLLYSLLKTARPRQWLKNLAIPTSLVFSGQLMNTGLVIAIIKSIIAFCFLASSNYIFNDIRDVNADRKHPYKKNRPIAKGLLPIPLALIASVLCAIIGLTISLHISRSFLIIACLFLILQYSYTLIFKHISLVDILVITAAYFIRVYAGEAATGYHISIWLSIAAFSLALFLAIGKRRSELTLLESRNPGIYETRASLSSYSETLLDSFTALSAVSTFITYSYYTFLERPITQGLLFYNFRYYLGNLFDRKWMMITIPLVLFGILRYMLLIYEGKGESPEKVLTSDFSLLTTIIIWIGVVILIIYGIGG